MRTPPANTAARGRPARWLAVMLAALLAAGCGGGSSSGNGPAPAPAKPRLVAFDGGKFAEGLKLPDFTEYWTLAEQRNGNTFPVKAAVGDDGVLAVRLDAQGKFAVSDGRAFQAATLFSVGSTLDSVATSHWNDDKNATSAALMLFADSRAPYGQLLELCHELVEQRVRNLWLVTRDGRDDSLRLLPLKVDTAQVFNDWYSLPPKEAAPTLHLEVRKGQAKLSWFDGAGAAFKAATDGDWKKALKAALPKFAARATRVQFELDDDAKLSEFAELAGLCAPLGYADVEPFWPRLQQAPDMPPVVKRRELAAYDDKLKVADKLDLPTLSDFWRISSGDRGLPAAATIDATNPLLCVRATADGSFATRSRDEPEWTAHSDDLGVLDALRRNAGEIDFDSGLSQLQVVLGMDRKAKWETFLGVLEMMKSVGVHRLYVVTNDVLGPTLRLLDLSLPLSEIKSGTRVASVLVSREGAQADGKYNITFLLDGHENTVTGNQYAPALTRWTIGRKADPEVLAVKLPRDEHFETLFTVLNAVALLGMHSIRIGG